MTELERRTETLPAILEPRTESLVTWALEADAAYTLAQKLVGTSFCPQQFRGKPEEAAAAMLSGLEIGLSPMAALRSFDVIQGAAAPRALTLVAVAQRHGHDIEVVSESASKVVVRGRRRGGNWQELEWTIARAQAMGLTGKDNWKKQPQAMLVARARAEMARRVAADAVLGIPYTHEELADEVEPTTNVQRAETKPATVARKRKPDPVVTEEPPFDDGPSPDPEPVVVEAAVVPDRPEPDPADRPGFITKAQLRMLHSVLNKAGLGSDRDAALALYAKVGGRPVDSSKNLSRIEGTRIIDHLLQVVDGVAEAELVEDVPHPDEF